MKTFKLSLILLTLLMIISGCSTDQETVKEDNQIEIAIEENNNQEETPNKVGSIIEIDSSNNTITISSMDQNLNFGEMPENEGGEFNPNANNGELPPEIPEGEMANGENPPELPEGEMANGENPPEKKDGEVPPEKPDGDMQKQNQDGENIQNFDEENKPEMNMDNVSTNSYKVTDDTIITNANGETITLNDLKINDFIEFTVDGDTLLTIMIANNDEMPNQK